MNAITDPGISGNPVRGGDLRADAKERHIALCRLIATMLETRPADLDGMDWAGPLTQAQWAERAELTLTTFKRLVKHPPIVANVRGMGRQKCTYLRLGDAPPQNIKKVKNTIARLWREHLGPELAAERDGYRDNGLCWGLAEDLPRGAQVKVFTHALRHWETFMSVAKLEIRIALELRAAGQEPDPDDPDQETAWRLAGERLEDNRFLRHPSLSFLRRFHWVATKVWWAATRERQDQWEA